MRDYKYNNPRVLFKSIHTTHAHNTLVSTNCNTVINSRVLDQKILKIQNTNKNHYSLNKNLPNYVFLKLKFKWVHGFWSLTPTYKRLGMTDHIVTLLRASFYVWLCLCTFINLSVNNMLLLFYCITAVVAFLPPFVCGKPHTRPYKKAKKNVQENPFLMVLL